MLFRSAVSRKAGTAVSMFVCFSGVRAEILMWRKPLLSQWLEPGKSRNKVSVGEPAEGSLPYERK